MEKVWLEEQYLVKHLTQEQIGKSIGTTGRWIGKLIKKFGIDTRKAEWVNVQCCVCGKTKDITRSHWKRTEQHYCSSKCYYDRMASCSNYTRSPYGMRKARQVMAEHIGRELDGNECVHHIDGDNNNNRLDNLTLFPNNNEHIKHHHRLRKFR